MISTNPLTTPTQAPSPKVASPQVSPSAPQAPASEITESFVRSQAPVEAAPAPPPVASSPPVVLREPTGEMAEMVENIRRAEETYRSADLTGLTAKASPHGANQGAPTSLVVLDEPPVPHDHGHEDHHPTLKHHLQHHGGLASHLGMEGGEQILTSAAANMAAHKAHALTEANNQVAHTLTEATSHATHAASQAASETATQAMSDSADATVTAAAHSAHEFTGALAGVAGAGAAMSGLLGVGMIYFGGKEIHTGLKHKNAEHTLEGVGSTLVGVRSGLAGVTLAATLHGGEVAEALAHGAHVLLPPLGIAHGAIDMGLGIKDIAVGIKKGDHSQVTKGALGVGLGGALAVAAIGGGLPALGVAAVFLAGKVIHTVHQHKHGKDHEGQAHQESPAHGEAPEPGAHPVVKSTSENHPTSLGPS